MMFLNPPIVDASIMNTPTKMEICQIKNKTKDIQITSSSFFTRIYTSIEINVDLDVYPIDKPGDAKSPWFLDDKPHYTWELHEA